MTAAQLLAYISLALLLQMVAGVAFTLGRRPSATGAAPSAPADEGITAERGEWSGWREFRVVSRAFEDAAQSQCSFHLQPVDGVPLRPFLPGQYLTFSLVAPRAIIGASGSVRTITRCYSLSDQPKVAAYRITIKRAGAPADRPELPPGLSSSYFHDRVREGDVLQVKAPRGHFFIHPDVNVAVVLIAGGIGITPMMSMLNWCIEHQPERRMQLYYGVRNSGDHAFKQVLEDLAAAHPAFKLNVAYVSPGADDVLDRDYQYLGHVDLALLRRTLPHGRHQFYVCGPPPMMQSLVPALREWGVHAEDILFEAFGPASVRPTGPVSNEPAVATSAAIDVRFSRSARTLAWDAQDANLLDFAERHGLAVDSGCRTGSCGTCQTRLLSGVVTYADPPDYDIPIGQCLLCVGKPHSALVLDV